MSKRDNEFTSRTLGIEYQGKESNVDLLSKEESILSAAKFFGFDIASIIDIAETKNLQTELNQFLENNYHGEMDWLENNKEFRSDPKKLWVKAKSIIEAM